MYTCDGCGKRRASNSEQPPSWRTVRVKVVGGKTQKKHYCTAPGCQRLADHFAVPRESATQPGGTE